ncbi:MAG TPA: hypothetical protein VFG68_03840 [Fimbriiglobus sp.]|nr:hypothetical protein [Fimbriiglobus sp.]
MDPQLNRTSLRYGVPGVLLQLAAPYLVYAVWPSVPDNLLRLIVLAGTVLLMIGLAYYAMAKGRSPWWCLLGFLSLVGLLGLALLEDRSGTPPGGP